MYYLNAGQIPLMDKGDFALSETVNLLFCVPLIQVRLNQRYKDDYIV